MTTIEVFAGPGRWHRPLVGFAVAAAVVAIVAVGGLLLDGRVLTGVPIWLKPFKFAVSFSVYGLTLAWMLTMLPRRSRAAGWAATVLVGVSVIELAIIVIQVVRGTTSHYNETTPLNAALWSAMGSSIMVLFVAQLVIAVVALIQRIPDRAMAWAIRLGLLLSLLGMAVAFPMVRQTTGIEGVTGAHSVGVPDGGPGMPLTGWSTAGGDLRIGHFVGLHALQALPLLAYALRRVGERSRFGLVLVGGVAYGVLELLLTWQALRAQPLLRPDGITLIALAALVAGTAAGVAAVLARGRRALP
ncbi:hypothetical protein [Actinoplanes sp. NPDC051851]|uniref:hypothetical protein n=1 Tax=Actinoplanes sp. NPDC051851 TaxID=3154753 RepID=UPI00341D9B54